MARINSWLKRTAYFNPANHQALALNSFCIPEMRSDPAQKGK
jgi:hypothetical protein